MVIDDLHVCGAFGRPHKTHAPLVIDANGAGRGLAQHLTSKGIFYTDLVTQSLLRVKSETKTEKFLMETLNVRELEFIKLACFAHPSVPMTSFGWNPRGGIANQVDDTFEVS